MTELDNKYPCCGITGSGPYKRWVRNSPHKRYQWYNYFCHKVNGKIRWCYLCKAKENIIELDNQYEPELSNNNETERQKRILEIPN